MLVNLEELGDELVEMGDAHLTFTDEDEGKALITRRHKHEPVVVIWDDGLVQQYADQDAADDEDSEPETEAAFENASQIWELLS